MSDTRNIGIIRVSMDLFAQMLHLPEGHKVVAVRQPSDPEAYFDVCIEGPSLPVVDLGTVTPRIDYVVSTTFTDKMVREQTFEGKFAGRIAPPSEENAA